MRWQWLLLHWASAVLLRLLLVLLGAGEALIWRPEVSTPANTVLKTREGVWLLQMGISPYQGSSCHVPPLWLALAAPWAEHRLLHVLPNIAADLAAAAAVLVAAACLFRAQAAWQQQARDAPWFSPEQLSVMYLYNPFAVMTCLAGTTTSAENAAALLAVAGAAVGSGPLVGLGLAAGGYLGLHPLLLLLPLMIMLWRGPEDLLQHVPDMPLPASKAAAAITAAGGGDEAETAAAEAAEAAAVATDGQTVAANGTAASPTEKQQQASSQLQQQHACQQRARGRTMCAAAAATLLCCAGGLLALSDGVLQHHPRSQCLAAAAAWLRNGQQQQQQRGREREQCWAVRVYRHTLLLEDLTPTIGLHWYFFTEMFEAFRPFFLFVFHSFAVGLALPAALRFPRRPLLLAWLQLFVSAMFKPYACVGDMVPWLALLPLLQQQLQAVRAGLFLVNSLLLLLVLGPAMWQQWIVADAANANFFFSITLLLGAWCTVFLVQLLRITVQLDRRLAGKPCYPVIRPAAQQPAGQQLQHQHQQKAAAAAGVGEAAGGSQAADE